MEFPLLPRGLLAFFELGRIGSPRSPHEGGRGAPDVPVRGWWPMLPREQGGDGPLLPSKPGGRRSSRPLGDTVLGEWRDWTPGSWETGPRRPRHPEGAWALKWGWGVHVDPLAVPVGLREQTVAVGPLATSGPLEWGRAAGGFLSWEHRAWERFPAGGRVDALPIALQRKVGHKGRARRCGQQHLPGRPDHAVVWRRSDALGVAASRYILWGRQQSVCGSPGRGHRLLCSGRGLDHSLLRCFFGHCGRRLGPHLSLAALGSQSPCLPGVPVQPRLARGARGPAGQGWLLREALRLGGP